MTDLFERLNEIKFFAGFTPQVKREYLAYIREEYGRQLDGPNAEYFRAYPGLALVAAKLEMVWDSVETDVEELSECSFGMFNAQEIQVVGNNENPTLEFDLDGTTERFTNDIATFAFRCFDFVASRFGRANDLVRPHSIYYPSDYPLYYVVFCTPDALDRLGESSLIPSHRDEVQNQSFMDWVDT